MIAAQADSGHRQVEPWQLATWRGFSLGVLATALFGGAMLVLMLPYDRAPRSAAGAATMARTDGSPDAARRLRAFRDEAGLSAAEERNVRALLADARDTRAAAVAYFGGFVGEYVGSVSGAESTSPGADNAAEIEEVVDSTIRARLIEAVGETRVAIAERHLGPFAAFVAGLH